MIVGWALGLTDFLLPRPDDNSVQENANAEPGMQDRLQAVPPAGQDPPVVALPGADDSNEDRLVSEDSNVSEVYDGDEESDSE